MNSIEYHILKICKRCNIRFCWLQGNIDSFAWQDMWHLWLSHSFTSNCSDQKSILCSKSMALDFEEKKHPMAISFSKFRRLSLTCDNFESYANFSGRTKMKTIVSPSWQLYTRSFFLPLRNTWAHNVKHFWWKKQTNSVCHSDEDSTYVKPFKFDVFWHDDQGRIVGVGIKMKIIVIGTTDPCYWVSNWVTLK